MLSDESEDGLVRVRDVDEHTGVMTRWSATSPTGRTSALAAGL
jgi:hypothetical protein